jgi:hypothetical protein
MESPPKKVIARSRQARPILTPFMPNGNVASGCGCCAKPIRVDSNAKQHDLIAGTDGGFTCKPWLFAGRRRECTLSILPLLQNKSKLLLIHVVN